MGALAPSGRDTGRAASRRSRRTRGSPSGRVLERLVHRSDAWVQIVVELGDRTDIGQRRLERSLAETGDEAVADPLEALR